MTTKEKVELGACGGLAAVGGVMGYLWAGVLTASEIVAVSNPVGATVGAVVFATLALEAKRESGE